MQASFAQYGMWIAEQTGVAGSAFHMPLAIWFDGEMNVAAMLSACTALADRHDLLSSRLDERAGVLEVSPSPIPPPVTHMDLSVEGERSLEGFISHEIAAGFDLRRGPLARFTLVTVAAGRHLLLFVAHHLAFDGESKDILVRDLAVLYAARLEVTAPELPPLRGAYGEHLVGERVRVEADKDAASAFWKPRWRADADLVLPGLQRSVHSAGRGESLDFVLGTTAWTGLAEVAEALGATRFEVLVAAVQALLYRYGNAEVVLSIDLGTRTAETRDHIGPFVNELPVFGNPTPDTTFRELVTAVRAELRAIYRYRHVPLTQAVGGMTPRTALTPVSVSYRKRAADPIFAGLTSTVEWAMFGNAARNTLHAQLTEHPDSLSVSLRYAPESIGRDDAGRIASHLRALLTAVVEEPGAPLRRLPLIPPDEREQLSLHWNATQEQYPPGATVVSLFAEQVRARPDAVAIVCDDGSLSFAELSTRSNQVAHRLRRRGVRPGTLVALHLGRSRAMVVGLLAVLKAGAAYLPLDPGHPPDRLAFILDDAGVTTVLTDGEPVVEGVDPIRIDDPDEFADEPETDPVRLPDPADLAYAIYTSGSTGRPKGVGVPHSALANLLLGMRDLLGAGDGDVWLALTSLSFDISALELLLPLGTGGRVIVAGTEATGDGRALVNLIRTEGVSHVQATPSGWRMMLAAGFSEPHVVALAGGEALPLPLARELRGRVKRLFNMYGPTETTIWSTAWEVPIDPARVVIGRPVANTSAYVLDGQGELAPIGVPGELAIAGAGVAQGYLGRTELTNERFVPDPIGHARMYLTGDRARWLPDGTLEFLGRTDHQVKIRGHRIELGEIEARLLEYPGIDQVAALVRGDDEDPLLAAYLVLKQPDGFDPDALRAHLGRSLPKYMMPEAFVPLDTLPLTPNGKLDRAALPDPPHRRRDAAGPPLSGLALSGLAGEVQVICQEVLRIDGLTADDDLFELGAHSLTLVQISSRLQQRLRLEVPLDLFFEYPTLGELAAALVQLRDVRDGRVG